MKDLARKKVLIIGTGVSGIGAAELLMKASAKLVLYEGNESVGEAEIRQRLPETIKADILIGNIPENLLKELVLVVISPGVAVDSPLIESFKQAGITVWGEIELAYAYTKGRIAAITGTNGKTTTTALVGRIMKDFYKDVYVVGNIGIPYTSIAMDTKEDSVIVAEISSFQLETIENFHPTVSAILNITPDHLDRHHTMKTYISVKEDIGLNQTKEDTIVLNYDDEITREMGEGANAEVLYFSRIKKLETGVFLDGDLICYRHDNRTETIIAVSQMQILGAHNVENAMAATGIAIKFGVPIVSIARSIREFQAVEHRIEYVAEINGVAYYNDSKGTNTDAAIKGIKAMVKPTILIGGGYDKEARYDEWIEAFDGRVKCLVLLGQTKGKIAECAKNHGFESVVFADNLEKAVALCVQMAEPGDAVLLSPACASWGMFKNFEERGNMFKQYVYMLGE